jgi:TonB family protein
MISRLTHLIALFAIALVVTHSRASGNVPIAGAYAQNDAIQWREFSSSEGRFSVLLPGTPVPKNSNRETSAGKIQFHEFALVLTNASYRIGYMDYADVSDDSEFLRGRLDSIRDEILARNKVSQLINERELKEGAFAGREFLVLEDQKLITILQTYLVHKRFYELAIQVPLAAAFGSGKATSRWQDQTESFKLIVSKFFRSFEVPEITESMDEFDRAVRGIERKSPGLVTAIAPCSPCDSTSNNSITSGVLNGKAVHLVTPSYPTIAHSAHAQGQVRVQVIIDLEGNVAAARAVDGHPLLRAAAEKAARESKFTPTTLEGKPVLVNGIIIYNFVSQ